MSSLLLYSHRGESRLLWPLSSKRRRLPWRPGHGGELSHRLPAGKRRPRSQGGRSDRRHSPPSLLQLGAAESGRHGRRSQHTAEEASRKCVWENLAGSWYLIEFYFVVISLSGPSEFVTCLFKCSNTKVTHVCLQTSRKVWNIFCFLNVANLLSHCELISLLPLLPFNWHPKILILFFFLLTLSKGLYSIKMWLTLALLQARKGTWLGHFRSLKATLIIVDMSVDSMSVLWWWLWWSLLLVKTRAVKVNTGSLVEFNLILSIFWHS